MKIEAVKERNVKVRISERGRGRGMEGGAKGTNMEDALGRIPLARMVDLMWRFFTLRGSGVRSRRRCQY